MAELTAQVTTSYQTLIDQHVSNMKNSEAITVARPHEAHIGLIVGDHHNQQKFAVTKAVWKHRRSKLLYEGPPSEGWSSTLLQQRTSDMNSKCQRNSRSSFQCAVYFIWLSLNFVQFYNYWKLG